MKQKNLITVVTDHQLTADTIAKAIGANEKYEGYYLGNGYAVTWTGGAIIEAAFSPTESFVLSTNMDCRLVYAHNFKFAMRDYDNLVGYKKTEQDKKQLATIKALWKMSRTVVNAMRPDLSGDLDFLSLYYFIAIPVDVRRGWMPILTKKAIVHAVNHGPQNRKEYEKWLSESIYNHLVDLCGNESRYKPTPIMEEVPVKDAPKVMEELGIGGSDMPDPTDGSCTITTDRIRIYTDHIPLFNLPSLLVEAAVELGFDHEKTVQTAYILYAKKLISYPMTVQNTVPGGVWKLMRRNMEILRYNSKWGNIIKDGTPSRRHNFKGENPYHGFGIVTTGLHPTDLDRDEEKLYNLIVKRVIDAFEPSAPTKGHKPKGKKKSHRNSRKPRKTRTGVKNA